MMQSVRRLFCSRLFPAAELLFLAEAADVEALRYIRLLAALGLKADECTCIPNGILDYAEKGWLILLEIAECHGLIDSDHRQNLLASFASITARDLILITAFADMAQFARWQAALAWGTSAWVAEVPDHLVIFGGRRLVGPAPDTNVHRRRNL